MATQAAPRPQGGSPFDQDFKTSILSQIHNIIYETNREVYKLVELYNNVSTDARIEQLVSGRHAQLDQLHKDLRERTEKWSTDVKKVNTEYIDSIQKAFKEFADGLDQSGRTAAKIKRCFTPWTEEVVATCQNCSNPSMSLGNSVFTTGESEQHNEPPALNWDDYEDMKFPSSRSAIEMRPTPEMREGDEQVRSVN